MAVHVKEITLWRTEVENKAGALASTLEPLAGAATDLRVVMGYRQPGTQGKAAIEVFPVAGRKTAAAAAAAGLSAAAIPALLVEGDNQPGFGHQIAQAVAGAGVSFAFFMGHVIGEKFAAVAGFETVEDAKKASAAIKKAARRR